MLARLGNISPGNQRVLIIAVCAVLFCLWLTWMPLTEIDEVRYSEATREMVTSGNYIIPSFNGAPRYQKPILYYWIQAASVRVFGLFNAEGFPSEAAARFPSAVAAILLILLVHGFLLYWLTKRAPAEDAHLQAAARGAALLGALALAIMPLMAIWARAATTDMTLTLFTTIAMLALLQADLARADGNARRWYMLASIAAALAFLTKGPVGIVIPGLTWLCYHAYRRNLPAELRRVPWLPVAGLFILIAVPWYLAIYVVDGPAFLNRFFMTENVQRFTTVMEGHGSEDRLQGLLLYLPMALALIFPFSPFLLHELFRPFAGNSRLRADNELVRIRCFTWAWLASVIGLFSLSRTQLPSYIHSIVGAAAILFALHVYGRLTAGHEQPAAIPRVKAWAVALEVGLFTLIGGGLTAYLIKALLQNEFTMVGWVPPSALPMQAAFLTATCLAVAGLLFVLGTVLWGVLRRTEVFVGWVVVTWTLVLGVLLFGVAPLALCSNYEPMARAGMSIRKLAPEVPVFAYFPSAPETLAYYAQRKIELCSLGEQDFRTRLQEALLAGHGAVILTDAAGQAQIGVKYTGAVLRKFDAIYVMQITGAPRDAQPAQP